MDAGAIQEHLELLQFDLARPLLVMKAPKGILGCGYIRNYVATAQGISPAKT